MANTHHLEVCGWILWLHRNLIFFNLAVALDFFSFDSNWPHPAPWPTYLPFPYSVIKPSGQWGSGQHPGVLGTRSWSTDYREEFSIKLKIASWPQFVLALDPGKRNDLTEQILAKSDRTTPWLTSGPDRMINYPYPSTNRAGETTTLTTLTTPVVTMINDFPPI